VSAETERLAFAAFLIFCRVGGCLMLMIGYASARVPMTVRLMIALAVSLALLPILLPPIDAALATAARGLHAYFIAGELMTGIGIGLMCRLFLAALQFGANVAANAAGFAGVPGTPIDDTEPAPALVTFISLAATALVFLLDLHLLVLRALIESYRAMPPAPAADIAWILDRLGGELRDVFALSLRLCGPFIIYAAVANLAIGLVSKLTPQISVYFVSLGLVTLGGLFLLLLVSDEWLMLFAGEYAAWLGAWWSP
jgi:flagellar biosynthetic protein FliR